MKSFDLESKFIFLAILFIGIFCLAKSSLAAQTSGGVNWLDSLQYTKPQFVPLTVPDESTAAKYYVDLANGLDGANCTTSSTPCKTLDGLAGKAYAPLRGGGTAGAYVYLKGNGKFALTGSFYGASGKEIVIKPWPGDNATYYFTASGSGNGGCNQFAADGNSTGIQWVIVDGGPNLQFVFRGSNSCDINYSGGLCFNGSNNTLARCQLTGNGSSCGDLMGMASSYNPNTFTNLRVINNEFHDALNVPQGSDNEQNYGIYAGGGSGCSSKATTITNIYIQNNIFRDLGSLGVQIEPRNTADNVVISGNAFHNLGKLSCGSRWGCRGGVALADSCGGKLTDQNVFNNLMWDFASYCVSSTAYEAEVYNNTCFDFGKGPADANSPLEAFSTYRSSYSGTTLKNNIIYAPNGTNPTDGSPFTRTNNLCATSKSCANTGQQTDSAANIFLSTDPNSPDFLKVKPTSKAVNLGVTVAGVLTDYFGTSRPQGSAYDIGAFEYASGGGGDIIPPAAPSGLSVS